MERMAAGKSLNISRIRFFCLDVSGDSLQRLMTFPCKTVTSIVAHVMAFVGYLGCFVRFPPFQAFVFSCFLQGFAQGFGGGFWVFLTQAVMFFAFLVVLARMLIFMLPIQFSGKSRKLGLIMDLVAASLVAAVVVLQVSTYSLQF